MWARHRTSWTMTGPQGRIRTGPTGRIRNTGRADQLDPSARPDRRMMARIGAPVGAFAHPLNSLSNEQANAHSNLPPIVTRSPTAAETIRAFSLALVDSRHRGGAVSAGHTHAFTFTGLARGSLTCGRRLILFVVKPMLVLTTAHVITLHGLATKLLLAFAIGGDRKGWKHTACNQPKCNLSQVVVPLPE